MRRRVSSPTSGEPFSARDTVAMETPQISATSWIVTMRHPLSSGSRKRVGRKRFRLVFP
jgi:hypothetical protein